MKVYIYCTDAEAKEIYAVSGLNFWQSDLISIRGQQACEEQPTR